MKTKLTAALALIAALLLGSTAVAAEQSEISAELKTIVDKVREQLESGNRTEADLAEHMKEFEALYEKYKNRKSDEVANILFMQATLYVQVLDNTEKGVALLEQIQRDFPDTRQGRNAGLVIESVKQQEESKKIQRALVEGTQFPDFEVEDTDGKPLSLAKYKGKVVLIDFWATWCGPCIHELPNVLKAYEKHHDKGFEIIGISLDKDEEALSKFVKDKNMPWPQYFDGLGWKNKLAVKYGVNSIPATYLIDGDGKIIGKGLRGAALEQAVAKALAKK